MKLTTLLPGTFAHLITPNRASLAPYQDAKELDIDPNRGYLAHFFRRDADPDNENVGRQYLHKALDKQK